VRPAGVVVGNELVAEGLQLCDRLGLLRLRAKPFLQCYQQLRCIYHASTAEARRLAEKVIAGFPSCPIPEVARLGRTLKAWRQQVLAYFDTSGVSNGGTEAINLIIEKVRRLAHGFRDFTHYRLRILLAASGNRAYRR
jgi:transposase